MNLKPLLVLPPLALGVAGFMWMTNGQDTPQQTREEARLAVRVMTVEAGALPLSATGYGRVAAMHSWTAVSQVDGRILELVSDLAEGTLVDEDTLLVQIDKTDFDLAIQKSRANIAAAEAALIQLEREEENSRRVLALEENIRIVAQAEFDRVRDLVDRGTSTAAALDTVRKALLAQENAVTQLNNTLDLYPAQRASAEATLAVRQAELAEAERALDNTTLSAPFRGRVAEANVEVGQFVRTGEVLLSLDAIDAVEVVASFQPQVLASVVQTSLGQTIAETTQIDLDPRRGTVPAIRDHRQRPVGSCRSTGPLSGRNHPVSRHHRQRDRHNRHCGARGRSLSGWRTGTAAAAERRWICIRGAGDHIARRRHCCSARSGPSGRRRHALCLCRRHRRPAGDHAGRAGTGRGRKRACA